MQFKILLLLLLLLLTIIAAFAGWKLIFALCVISGVFVYTSLTFPPYSRARSIFSKICFWATYASILAATLLCFWLDDPLTAFVAIICGVWVLPTLLFAASYVSDFDQFIRSDDSQ
jgi:hypothetical protein